ncbi:MAG: AAA family ATPase [Bacteroidota bacterium]
MTTLILITHNYYLAALMLNVQSISLIQFKNYQAQSFGFPERVTGICGNNGVGKTNLLDAIHYLCFTKKLFYPLGCNVCKT